MSLYNGKITFGGVDLTEFIKDYQMTLGEPKSIADNPHAPGTLEHKDWEYANVHAPRRLPCDARDQATIAADERIARVKASYRGRAAAPTFAYGKTVDELMEFVADDKAGPLLADFTEDVRSAYSFKFDWEKVLADAKFGWPSAPQVQGILSGGMS